MKVLIAEDNIPLLNSLEIALTLEGYEVVPTATGEEALLAADDHNCDIAILDVNLPGISGFDTARKFRKKGQQMPLIFLTARDSIEDKLEGFSTGADDYLVKPFDLSELLARLQALTRRLVIPVEGLFFGDIRLDQKRRSAFVCDEPVNLTRIEYTILEYLILNPHQVLSQDQIANRIWGAENIAESNSLSVHVHNLRKKLSAAGSSVTIKSLRNLGYTLS